ncbi:MAG: hypothetical protein JXP72_09475 [Coriobacteriia bacterium]|nr:hypothetical protein [Coriobacteriia bacterium]
MSTSSNIRRVALIGVFVAEVALMAVLAFSAQAYPEDVVIVGPGEAVIEAYDQQVWGAFAVARVVTPVDSWVVVRANRGSDVPAELLGATAVPAGESRNVAVAIDRSRELPPSVIVSLVADLGEPGEFEYVTGYPNDVSLSSGDSMMGGGAAEEPAAGDMMGPADKVIMAPGETVSAAMRVTRYDVVTEVSEAWIDTAFIDADRTTVTVDRVVSPGPGWVAVIRGRFVDDDANELLGVAPVPAGQTHSVQVPLTGVPGSGDLTVVLCADLGMPGEAEIDPTDLLGSPDSPYFALSYFVQVPVLERP